MRSFIGFCSACLLLMQINVQAQSSFIKVWDGGSIDWIHSVKETQDSNYVIGAQVSIGLGLGKLAKLDTAGNILWTETYQNTNAGAWTQIRDVYEKPDGNFVVVGAAVSSAWSGTELSIMETDPQGNEIWSDDLSGGVDGVALSIQPAGGGSYVLAGTKYIGSGNNSIQVARVDSGGNMLWDNAWGYGPGAEIGNAIVPSDNGYMVAGYGDYAAGDRMLAAFIDSVGDTIHTHAYGWNNYTARATAAVRCLDGNYLLAGYNQTGFVVKIDELGDTLWTRHYLSDVIDQIYDVQQLADSTFIAVGVSYDPIALTLGDVALVKLDPQGNVLWSRAWRYSDSDYAFTATATSDGGFLLGGRTKSFSGYWDQLLIKTDSLGCVAQADTSAIAASATELCVGATAEIDGGFGAFDYVWNTGDSTQLITVDSTGWYSVIRESACFSSTPDSIFIDVHPLPVSPLNTTSDQVLCAGDTLFLQGGNGFESLLWATGDTVPALPVTLGNDSCEIMLVPTDVIGNGWNGGEAEFATNGVVMDTLGLLTGYADTLSYSVAAGDVVSVAFTVHGSAPGHMGIQVLDAYAALQFEHISVNQLGVVYTDTVACPQQAAVFVTLTDTNGCTAQSDTVLFVAEPEPVLTLSATDTVACAGDTVGLVAIGAFDNFMWSNAATGPTNTVTQDGIYTVTATVNSGCYPAQLASVQASFINLPQVSIVPAGPTTFCAGGLLEMNLSSSHTTYLWSTGATTASIDVHSGGAYVVTVSNSSGCFGSSVPVNVVVNTPQALTIDGGANNSFCAGDSLQLLADAGFSNYSWSSGASGSVIYVQDAGSYTVSAVDANGCVSESAGITVSEWPLPEPVITVLPDADTLCLGDSVLLDAGIGYVSYGWSTGATSQFIFAFATGNYSAGVQDANGCLAQTEPVSLVAVDCGVGIAERGPLQVALWPNPAGDRCNVVCDEAIQRVELLSALGVRVTADVVRTTSHAVTINTSDLAAGAYFVRVQSARGTLVRPLWIQK